jgi:hypothetical protein
VETKRRNGEVEKEFGKETKRGGGEVVTRYPLSEIRYSAFKEEATEWIFTAAT